MRVLSSFLGSIVFFIIVGVVAALVTREVLLSLAVSNVRSAIAQMRQIGVQTGPYILECQKKGDLQNNPEDDNDNVIGAIQMRFTSNTDYVVEVVCSRFPLEPITVKTDKLPWPAQKDEGSGGITWGGVRSGMALQVWGRHRSVVTENLEVVFSSQPDVNLGLSPVTSCSGLGYQCCQPETLVGEGALLSQATDCPKTCYQQCQNRPVILSFTSQPFFDPETRQVAIGRGETVSFRYVLDPRGTTVTEVKLDFGDGNTQTLTEAQAEADHVYTCNAGSCQYQAVLTAITSTGITSYETPVARLLVVVK